MMSTATAAAFDEEGWLRTGDIAYTRKGKVYINDRAKVSNSAKQQSIHSLPKTSTNILKSRAQLR